MKRIPALILIALLAALLWYLFIKPFDYRVSFEVKANTGTVNQTIKIWNTSLEAGKMLGQRGLEELTQQIKFGDSTHIYEWNLSAIHDSLTKVVVYAKDAEHSLANKISLPFSDTNFEKRTRNSLLDFNDMLQEQLQSFKVRIVGEQELESTYCAYVRAKTTQIRKARSMMRDLPLLSNLLVENQVQLNGMPFIEILEWNQENDSITFDFCYPIVRSERLPQHPDLKYKRFYAKNALKAEYNGNYITSDRAWYALENYAKSNGIAITGRPIEFFYNNPNMGGDALQWRAEIFMPIEEDYE